MTYRIYIEERQGKKEAVDKPDKFNIVINPHPADAIQHRQKNCSARSVKFKSKIETQCRNEI
jgi:hypothetical protein